MVRSLRGQKCFSIALVQKDVSLKILTVPANTCTCPLKVYPIIHKNYSSFLDFNRNYEQTGERSGRVLDVRPRGQEFKPHRRHYVVVLEKDTFIRA